MAPVTNQNKVLERSTRRCIMIVNIFVICESWWGRKDTVVSRPILVRYSTNEREYVFREVRDYARKQLTHMLPFTWSRDESSDDHVCVLVCVFVSTGNPFI